MFHGNRMSAKLFLVCDPADGCAAGPQGCKRDVGRNMLKRLLPRMQQSQITDHRSQRLKAELSHTDNQQSKSSKTMALLLYRCFRLRYHCMY